MQRRRLTLKRIDPWTVLKFGGLLNVCLYLVVLVGFGVLWFFVSRLGLDESVCDIVLTLSPPEATCDLSGGAIFRTLVVLGMLGAIVQTGLFVLGAFLYNTIAGLTGGIQVTMLEEGAQPTRPRVSVAAPRDRSRTARAEQAPKPDETSEPGAAPRTRPAQPRS